MEDQTAVALAMPRPVAVSSGVGDGLRAAFVQGMGRAYAISGVMIALALVLTVGRGDTTGAERSAEPAGSPSPGND